jgi:hypothetical protein
MCFVLGAFYGFALEANRSTAYAQFKRFALFKRFKQFERLERFEPFNRAKTPLPGGGQAPRPQSKNTHH